MPRGASPWRSRSRRPGALLAAGYRELVVTGTHLGQFGTDLIPRRSLADLVEALIALPAPHFFGIRLSSIEPQEIDARLIEMLAGSPALAPHLHLPLQSGSDDLLRAMRRSYRTPAYRRQVQAVTSRVAPLALGADLIVGFPGETEADFRRTLHFLAELPFTHLHPFTFSPRPGTPAAARHGRPPGDIAARRLAAANSLVGEKNRAFRRALLGRTARVLVEETAADGVSEGFSEHYVRVRFPAPRDLAGFFADVALSELTEDGLSGHLIEALP